MSSANSGRACADFFNKRRVLRPLRGATRMPVAAPTTPPTSIPKIKAPERFLDIFTDYSSSTHFTIWPSSPAAPLLYVLALFFEALFFEMLEGPVYTCFARGLWPRDWRSPIAVRPAPTVAGGAHTAAADSGCPLLLGRSPPAMGAKPHRSPALHLTPPEPNFPPAVQFATASKLDTGILLISERLLL